METLQNKIILSGQFYNKITAQLKEREELRDLLRNKNTCSILEAEISVLKRDKNKVKKFLDFVGATPIQLARLN